MSLAARIAWDDTVLPFQLDRADIRGRVARVDTVLDRILGQHSYPTPVAALVAETTLLTAMIGQTVKLRWKLQIQIRGNGPIKMMAADYFAPEKEGQAARMRAWAAFDLPELEAAAGAAPIDLLGEGLFGLLIDQGPGTSPYQGITPIAGGSLASCAETYFAQSEQLPTRFSLALGEATEPGGETAWRGGGVMLQQLPKGSPSAAQEASGPDGLLAPEDFLDGDDAENWTRAGYLLDTVEETELIGPHVGPETLLTRLFHEEQPRIFDAQAVEFGCTCGPEKVVDSLAGYSAEDVAGMVTDEGVVTADCQFCGAHYEFDPKELGKQGEDGGEQSRSQLTKIPVKGPARRLRRASPRRRICATRIRAALGDCAVAEHGLDWRCLCSYPFVTTTVRLSDGRQSMTSGKDTPGELPPLNERERKILAEQFGISDVVPDSSNIRGVADAPEPDRFYRPLKEQVTVRLDADVLAWLKSQGKGYQTRMNAILRREMLLAQDPEDRQLCPPKPSFPWCLSA